MSVPATGNFNMFGLGDDTTIQGAIESHGGAVSSVVNFNGLIAQSVSFYFDPTYAANVSNPVTDVSGSQQFRGYPKGPFYYVAKDCQGSQPDTILRFSTPKYPLGGGAVSYKFNGICYYLNNATSTATTNEPTQNYSDCATCVATLAPTPVPVAPTPVPAAIIRYYYFYALASDCSGYTDTSGNYTGYTVNRQAAQGEIYNISGVCYELRFSSNGPGTNDFGDLANYTYYGTDCYSCYGITLTNYWSMINWVSGDGDLPSVYFASPPDLSKIYLVNGKCYTIGSNVSVTTSVTATTSYTNCDDCVVANYTTSDADASTTSTLQYGSNSSTVCSVGIALGITYFYGGTNLCTSLDYIYFNNLSNMGFGTSAQFYIANSGGTSKRKFIRIGNTNWAKPLLPCQSC